MEPSLVSELRKLAELLLALSGNEAVREPPGRFDKDALAADLEKLLGHRPPRIH